MNWPLLLRSQAVIARAVGRERIANTRGNHAVDGVGHTFLRVVACMLAHTSGIPGCASILLGSEERSASLVGAFFWRAGAGSWDLHAKECCFRLLNVESVDSGDMVDVTLAEGAPASVLRRRIERLEVWFVCLGVEDLRKLVE